MLAPQRKTSEIMQPERLTHFKQLLIAELREHSDHVRNDQAAALELSDDGVKDTVDMSLMDVLMSVNYGDLEPSFIVL